jgi:hypothetical protein
MPQQPYDVHSRKTFKEGLRKKLKLAIIGMPKALIIEVANSTREIEEKMPTTHRNKQMKNRLMMSRRRKEGKDKRIVMVDINEGCFAKNATMKAL